MGLLRRSTTIFRGFLRYLTSEWIQESSQWPLLIPLAQSVLNHLSSPSRAEYASLTITTGLPAHYPFIHVFEADANRFVTSPLTVDRLKEHMIELRDSLEEMHKRVADSVFKSRDAKRRATNKHPRRSISTKEIMFWLLHLTRTISQSYNPKSFLIGSSLFVI